MLVIMMKITTNFIAFVQSIQNHVCSLYVD